MNYTEFLKSKFFFTHCIQKIMTYTEFLKSKFGEDGSLARVIREIGGNRHIIKRDNIEYLDTGEYICDWNGFSFGGIFGQTPETQKKIAQLLGWKE